MLDNQSLIVIKQIFFQNLNEENLLNFKRTTKRYYKELIKTF